MAKENLTEAASKNILETAVEVLQDADDAGSGGRVKWLAALCFHHNRFSGRPHSLFQKPYPTGSSS